ncbi:hypothetical protein G647_01124 [Cladophialophora carrionii CBS 160.54]|uniref:Uncharacterized protein n=1 Tax=Cladophialophora carrionii CBS 160.54 TaxID=1279043 RepID=V9DQT2_9EURO|nr:uncharacterized protein G647_01124 [Cladophialophora carrionii CBS 160.54]ETI28673.1 hypothetical protein G647_01124 [Cladophialophora carrionii CBS 160.54]
MTTAASPTRRVLGPKDPNAPLQQLSKPSCRGLQAADPVSRRDSPARSPLTSPRAGQKRKLQEVYESAQADSQEAISVHTLSQVTEMQSDALSEIEHSAQPSMTWSKSTLNTSFASFSDSHEEPSQVEAEFHIHEEPSQQTLDTMHAVSLTQNTSQLVPPLRPNLVKEASQVSLSMSSLIDFDNNRSSQEDDNMQMIEELDVSVQVAAAKEDARKEMMLERAEALRTRLQLAFYKIQTNQITTPLARLQVPNARSSSPSLPAMSSSPRSSSTVRPDCSETTAISPESRVALARARATSGPRPAVRALSTLPIPKIAPTAFSARWNDEDSTLAESKGTETEREELPSSPPLRPVDDYPREAAEESPRLAEPRTPEHSSSSVICDLERDAGENEMIQGNKLRPRALTSSVVKGEAANSLLELVRAARSGRSGMSDL